MKKVALLIMLSLFFYRESYSQESYRVKPVKLSGFRIGMTYLSGDAAEELQEAIDDDGALPMITQFGWQFERQYPAGESGLAAIVEVIPLIGGFNLGLLIPSVSTLVGIRTETGYELGAGPIIHAGGSSDNPKLATGFIFAAGMTKKFGNLNIPFNFAISQGKSSGAKKSSLRLSLMTGFAF